MPLISLIISTRDRRDVLKRLFDSLAAQTFNDFEVIVNDQNDDQRVRSILEDGAYLFPFKVIPGQKGLSSGRNVGIKVAEGELLSFPDDDCWYHSPDFLDEVVSFFAREKQVSGLCGTVIDENACLVLNRWDAKPGIIEIKNVLRRSVGPFIFLRSELVRKVGYFDKNMGVGSDTIWQSGEESDFLIRALKKGAKLIYAPELQISHPDPDRKNDNEMSQRYYKYGLGFGYLLRKHGLYILFIIALFRSSGGLLLSLLNFDLKLSRRYLNSIKGRVRGWISCPKDHIFRMV